MSLPSACCLVAFSLVSLSLARPAFSAEGPATFKAGEFTFQRPSDWQWVQTSSSMRKAQLKISDAATKEVAEVIFFHFGEGNGGGTQANIDRWFAQFQEPKDHLQAKVEEVTANKHKVTFVQAQGTYLSGMPGGPKTAQPATMLVGAILESEQGNVFVRLTGPVKLAQASQGAFRKMITGGLEAR